MTEQTVDPQAAAAQQLAAQAAAAPTGDAGESIEAMQQAQRQAVLPFEQEIQQMMQEFRDGSNAMAQRIKDLEAQLAGAKAAAGPPAVEQYAGGIEALLKAHAAANPDLPRGTFDDVLALAGKLRTAASDAVASRDVSDVNGLAGQIQTWVSRFRGKHIDFSSLTADLELLAEAAVRLAA